MNSQSNNDQDDWTDVHPVGGPSGPSSAAPSQSQSQSAQGTTTSTSPAASSSTSSSTSLNAAFMQSVFPDKDDAKRSKWLQVLLDEEFSCVSDLALLSAQTWERLDLPLAVRLKLQAHVSAPRPAAPAPAAPSAQQSAAPQLAPVASTPVVVPPPSSVCAVLPSALASAAASASASASAGPSALDVVVMDISSSMKARSAIDALKTREDVSKVLFHVFVDRMLGLELNHGVGLLAFGQTSRLYPITRNYESFHDELGRLDANQNATKLYDSIQEAGQALIDYAAANQLNIVQGAADSVKLRIFTLTDGEDNASKNQAWQVAQWLQDRNIVLDSLPLAGANRILQAMSTATGGLCLRVSSEQQGIALFEREAVLHLAYRENAPRAARVTSSASLDALCSDEKVIEEVAVAKPVQLSKPVASKEVVSQMIVNNSSKGSPAVKRISKELAEILATDDFPTFVSEDDCFFWRVVLPGPAGTPYEGRFWMVSFQFPVDYPFKPPRVRFQTPIYHANVNNDGGICVDILKDQWSPALTASKVMISLRSLLTDPNFNDPLDAFKAQIGLTDLPRYAKEAKDHAAKYAGASLADLKDKFAIQ